MSCGGIYNQSYELSFNKVHFILSTILQQTKALYKTTSQHSESTDIQFRKELVVTQTESSSMTSYSETKSFQLNNAWMSP